MTKEIGRLVESQSNTVETVWIGNLCLFLFVLGSFRLFSFVFVYFCIGSFRFISTFSFFMDYLNLFFSCVCLFD